MSGPRPWWLARRDRGVAPGSGLPRRSRMPYTLVCVFMRVPMSRQRRESPASPCKSEGSSRADPSVLCAFGIGQQSEWPPGGVEPPHTDSKSPRIQQQQQHPTASVARNKAVPRLSTASVENRKNGVRRKRPTRPLPRTRRRVARSNAGCGRRVFNAGSGGAPVLRGMGSRHGSLGARRRRPPRTLPHRYAGATSAVSGRRLVRVAAKAAPATSRIAPVPIAAASVDDSASPPPAAGAA
jgi:hypothetical protein